MKILMNRRTIYISIACACLFAIAISLVLVFAIPSTSTTSIEPPSTTLPPSVTQSQPLAEQSATQSVTQPPPSLTPSVTQSQPLAEQSTTPPPSTTQPPSVTQPPPSLTPKPTSPPPSSYEDISKEAMSDPQKLILKNTFFELFEINLLIDSFNLNNDTITIKTSPNSKKKLNWNGIALTLTYKSEDPKTVPNFTQDQARLIKKFKIDDVEFNVTSNIYSSYFSFSDLSLGNVFDKLINSHYQIDRFKIKYTDNSFSDSNLYFTSDKTSTKEMTLDLIKNELSSRLSGRIIPSTAKTITINDKLILEVEHITNEKRIDTSPEQRPQSGSGNFSGFTPQTVEQKTGIRIFTIKKISEKIPEKIPEDITEGFVNVSYDKFGIF